VPLNGQTGADATSYFETLPPERLEAALWLESERMGYAVDAVTDTNLDAEREFAVCSRPSGPCETGRSRTRGSPRGERFSSRGGASRWPPSRAPLRSTPRPAQTGAVRGDADVSRADRSLGRDDLVKVATRYLGEANLHVLFVGYHPGMDVRSLRLGALGTVELGEAELTEP